MPKLNRTLRYLVDRDPDMLIPGSLEDGPLSPGGYLIADESEAISEETFVELLKSRPGNADVFLDAGFIPNFEMHHELCDMLLSRRLSITPGTWRELQPWLDNPHYNRELRDALLAAKKNGHPNVVFLDPIDPEDVWGRAVWYYIRLLGFRKEAHEISRNRFVREKGREPSESELSAAAQSLVERGIVLATKGAQDKDNPNLFVDEEVVVRSILAGLVSNRPSEILTRDTDLIEQFYKATYLLDTHFRSMLFGQAYVEQPLNFPVEALPNGIGIPLLDQSMKPEGLQLIKKHSKGELDLIPKDGQVVPLSCSCLGGPAANLKHTFIIFLGHHKMAEVLKVKGMTGGLSSDRLNGKNIHICIHPNGYFDGRALIGYDCRVEENGIGWSPIDIELSLRTRERCDRHIQVSRPESFYGPTGSVGMTLAELGPPIRLGLQLFPTWKETTWEELAAAVTWLEPRGRFFADRSLLASPMPPSVIEALSRRHLFSSAAAAAGAGANCPPDAVIKSDGVMGKHGWLRNWRLPVEDPRSRPAFDYYVALLGARRIFGRIVLRGLEERFGRLPREQEWTEAVLSYRDGNQRLLRATSGLNYGPEVFETDLLLVYAAMTAVIEGMPIVILTREPSTFEQFVSLTQFLADEYRAWAILEQISDKNLSREPHNPEFEKLGFKGPPLTWMLGPPLRMDITPLVMQEVADLLMAWLPANAMSTPLSCWLLEGDQTLRVYAASFGLERPMHRLFDIKRETNGLNTNQLGGRNGRIQMGPIDGAIQPTLWITEDLYTPIGSRDFPGDDFSHLELKEIPTFSLVGIQNYSDPFSFPWHRVN